MSFDFFTTDLAPEAVKRLTKAEQKFLDVIFDRKLSLSPHVKYIREKGLKALNVLKFLSQRSWGADKETMLKVHRSVVHSTLEYG